MDQNWKLGDDMVVSDNLLDGITFEDLILTVHCNCWKEYLYHRKWGKRTGPGMRYY